MAQKQTKTELKKPQTKKKEKLEVKQNWSSDEKKASKDIYGCEILVDNGSWQDVSKTEYPNDASIITYKVDDNLCYDLTRGLKTKIFDMYYDKFKKGLQDIGWGRGTISPKMWGYKSPQQSKKKK